MSVLRWLLLLMALAATPASALDFPKLTGRVVDAANLLSPQEEAELDQKLAAVEQANSSRQLVIATIPDLQGDDIEDYGVKLGRAWGIGQKGANNGIILIVAPTEHKVRIEVGYGLEPIMTDALSSVIINTQIVPRFKANDYPGGIKAGADAIIEQLQAPPEQAEQRALAAGQQQARASSHQNNGSLFPLIFWIIVMVFVIIPLIRSRHRGRRYGRGHSPVVIWGPGLGGWGGGSSSWGSGGGSSWGGGGGSSWGGGGGGFSGGGGSFGGGGASGSW